MTPRTKKSAALFALIALGVAACGGAPTPVAATGVSPSTEPDADTPSQAPEPTTIEEAEQRVARARQELEEPHPALQYKSRPAGDHEESDACRALRSLERAAKALCRLAGEDDARCKDATAAFEKNRVRVQCP